VHRRRSLDPFDKRAMALSTSLHVALFAVAWLSTLHEPEEMVFLTYEIELVSPPPSVQAEEVQQATEELVIERPEPEPLPPEPEVEEVVPVEEPEPEPDPPPVEREEPVEEQPEPDEEVTVAAAPVEEVAERPDQSGEGIEVRMEGLRRDYPAYYNNIIQQILRCFRWRDGGRWETTVLFWISRDGSASDIEFQRRSGNTAFDFEAMGAVDCAGRGRFGPLPEELPYERFQVQFTFQPSGQIQVFFPTAGDAAGVTSER
jgi:outer membrane biosynthesis protein TonB